MRDHILLHINGTLHRIDGDAAFDTLANYLRQDVAATGTKIVCEEGDCGACTVLTRRSADAEYRPVNSCILNLAQLDGSSIVTVEGLGNSKALHPVQTAMVQCHGAQCGYCTPGFVVAMAGMFETCDRVNEKQVRDGLTGNLCRCTGYEPIIKAALAVDGSSSAKMHERYPALPDANDSVQVDAFFAPATLDEAIAFKRDHPGCTIVQGGTDVGVWVNKRNFAAPAMLSLAKIDSLRELREEDGAIVAGANTSLADFETFIIDRIPELAGIMAIFGSPQIKNAGTLVGNIANGSPIGDTLPYLFVAGAVLELNNGTRSVPIDRYYLGYRKFDLQADEIITRVRIPIVRDTLKLYKVSRRKDLDISAFTAAIRLTMSGDHIDRATIAYGGVAPTVVRMPRTEAFLTGKTATLDTFEQAGRIARAEIKPISDVRGSADYRLQLAENIMPKFWHEAFGETAAPRLAHA
ncbi:MAG: xanthine dehydrogenase small subunit [Thermoanaerobaculia bacterium]|jgi:xanthine dehydrogenase small subunit|nr:xanthine dehydrogenase small subunit [Thermoanaerobaculia bacterium]